MFSCSLASQDEALQISARSMCAYLLKMGFSDIILHSAVQVVIAFSLRWCDGGARNLRTVVCSLSEEDIPSRDYYAQLHCITLLMAMVGMCSMLTCLCKYSRSL